MNLERFLKIALFLQLVLLIFLTYPKNTSDKKDVVLSNLKKENLTQILFEENDKKLTLVKENDIWLLKDKFKFPANQEKTARILDSIFTPQELRRVGKSKNALIKYKLSNDNYIEKIKLSTKDQNDTLILGDTPEFKKIYIRNENDTESFIVNLSKFDLGVDVNTWYQKDFLGLTKELVKSITFSPFSLVKDNDGYIVANADKNEKYDNEKINFLVNKVFSLSFLDILSSEKISIGKPDFKIDIEKEDGTKITLNFKKIDNNFILKVSNMPWDFSISKNLFNDLKSVSKKDIL